MIELVAYGPGLNMFVAEESPVTDRISAMSLEMENLSLCGLWQYAERDGGQGWAIPLN